MKFETPDGKPRRLGSASYSQQSDESATTTDLTIFDPSIAFQLRESSQLGLRDHYSYAHLTDFERSDARSSSLAMVRVPSSARHRWITPSSQRLNCRFPRLLVPVDCQTVCTYYLKGRCVRSCSVTSLRGRRTAL